MRQVWAQAVAAGVDDALFWRSTPAEVRALLAAIHERERDADRRARERAGLIASTLINLHLRPGKRPMEPLDFWRDDSAPEIVTPQEMQRRLLAWVRSAGGRISPRRPD